MTNANKLAKYRKLHPDKLDAVTTSVTLERKQLEFIKKQNLNLSLIVRDCLDALMIGADNDTDIA